MICPTRSYISLCPEKPRHNYTTFIENLARIEVLVVVNIVRLKKKRRKDKHYHHHQHSSPHLPFLYRFIPHCHCYVHRLHFDQHTQAAIYTQTHRPRHTETEAQRHTDRQTDRHRQTDRQMKEKVSTEPP